MTSLLRVTFLALAVLTTVPAAHAKVDVGEITERAAEKQIRNLVEPLLDKYCHEECKLLSVSVNVDLAGSDDVSPGFDDVDPKERDALSPSYGRVKLLLDQKLGSTPRTHLLELIQQYLDTLDYPVKIETTVTQFPQPEASAARVAEMRDRILKQFRNTMSELFQKFCPEQCLLGDLDLKTELVNVEEAQYGSSGEFFQDGDIAIRVRDLSATLLLDETLGPEERQNLIDMAQLKSNFLHSVQLTPKVLKFPHGLRSGTLAEDGSVMYGPGGLIAGKSTSQDSKSNSTNTSTANNNSSTNNSQNSKNSTTEKSDSRFNTNSNSDSKTNSTNSNNSESKNNNVENNTKEERFERFEKVERVESGDAIQKELDKFKIYGLIFACSILSLLIFLAAANFRPRKDGGESVHRMIQSFVPGGGDDRSQASAQEGIPNPPGAMIGGDDRLATRYQIEHLRDELMHIFATGPKVAKHVFTKVLTEDGVEITAHYIHMLGENVVLDMLRDPSLQSDMAELMDFYAKNTFSLNDEEKLELLQRLHNRAVAGKLAVYGNRSSNLFDFLAEMDGLQILEMIRAESLTVKAMVLTQCDPTKRAAIYAQLDEQVRMAILSELSRIDYLPRDYIYNVSNALKRKRRENPKLNTEALPGSEVLVSLLERTGTQLQKVVVRNLEASNPDSARVVKAKLVCLDTLRFLRDSQLLEVVLSLRHDELLQFLKGCPNEVRQSIFAKSPKELIAELEEELAQVGQFNREAYQALERKVLNRMKIMANEGLINLVETNERMFAESRGDTGFIQAGPPGETTGSIRQAG